MKKSRYILFIFALSMAFSAKSQFSVGLRDTRYVNVQYTLKDHYLFCFEHSLYPEKLGCQYFRIYAGAKTSFGPVIVQGTPYFGKTWGNHYWNLGLNADARYKFRRLGVDAGFTPHYDSELGYSSLWLGRLSCDITKHILVTAAVTNRPEYREPETRLRGGFRFTVGNLWVQPEISVPLGGDSGRNIRVLASMNYTF